MIILGTPSINLDFGIPDWAVLLIMGLMALLYYVGRIHGFHIAREEGKGEEKISVSEET